MGGAEGVCQRDEANGGEEEVGEEGGRWAMMLVRPKDKIREGAGEGGEGGSDETEAGNIKQGEGEAGGIAMFAIFGRV